MINVDHLILARLPDDVGRIVSELAEARNQTIEEFLKGFVTTKVRELTIQDRNFFIEEMDELNVEPLKKRKHNVKSHNIFNEE